MPPLQACWVKLKEARKRILLKFKKLAEEKPKERQEQDTRVVGPQKSSVPHVPEQRKSVQREERPNAAERPEGFFQRLHRM